MEFINKHIVIFKSVIALLLLVAFCMMFCRQISLVFNTPGKGTFIDVFFRERVNAIGSFIGYLLLLISAVLVAISAYRSYKGKESYVFDIVALLLIVIGMVLIALVSVFYVESAIGSYCPTSGNSWCEDEYRLIWDYSLKAAPIVALVLSGISYLALIFIDSCHSLFKD